jgi:hypothetical protein
MNRDEIERMKEEEKAHLREVRALKQQLREANRKKGLLDALKGLDTSALDATHEEMLRKVTEKNVTSEARFELAMEALDEAEKQEATRQEMARIEAERQKKDAADLVRQMKAEMLGDAAEHAEAQGAEATTKGTPTDEAMAHDAPAKTIGPAGGPDTAERAGEPEADDAPPARSIGRFSSRRDPERD